jgi:hypothetical protein
MAATVAAPAVALGWMYHPNSGDYVYCEYYGSAFWCYLPHEGLWPRALSPELMMQNDGWQPV